MLIFSRKAPHLTAAPFFYMEITFLFNAYLDDQKALLDSYLFFLYADVISGQCSVDEMWKRWDDKFAEFQKQNGVPGF